MKLAFTSLALIILSFQAAFATGPISDKQYQCIAESLQAINSDIYYNLSRTDIDIMLQIPEMAGHIEAVNAARACGVR